MPWLISLVNEFLKKKLYLMDKALCLGCIPKLLTWGLQNH